jgi:hypothetical protein
VVSYLSRLLGVVRTVSGSPSLLRVELAFVGFNVAECSQSGQPRWLRLDKVGALACWQPAPQFVRHRATGVSCRSALLPRGGLDDATRMKLEESA